MFTTAFGRNDAALITAAYCAAEYDLTAAAGTDNVEQTGATLDLAAGFGTTRFASATAVVAATATLTATKTLTVTGIWEQSADGGTTWTEIGTDQTVLTLTGAAGGSTETGAGVLGCNLAEVAGKVRFKFKPDLSATATDTAKVETVYLLTSPTRI